MKSAFRAPRARNLGNRILEALEPVFERSDAGDELFKNFGLRPDGLNLA
jgi:hypothetical protein